MSILNVGEVQTNFIKSTTGTTALTINSSGLISTGNNPFFMGRPSIDYSAGGMPTGIMGIIPLINNGNHFNPSNSRFTAPITGYYQTTWGGLQLLNGVTSLMVNGTRTYNGNHMAGSQPSYATLTQTAVLLLNAGDYLQIEQWNGGGYFLEWYLWSVVLLG